MNNTEDILDKAIKELKSGKQALSAFNNPNVSPLLQLSEQLLSLPKNIVPTPLKRRKYAMATSKGFWLTWLHISKFVGVSVSVMLLVSAFSATGYAAYKSRPGTAFFPIKKLAEKGEVILAYSPDKKASLQITIAKQRLSDAQTILQNPESPAEQKNAALSELSTQTKTAVEQVKNVASTNPTSEQNHPLLNSLESLTNDQQALLSKLTDTDTKTATKDALLSLKENTDQISEIRLSVAAATSPQGLAKVNPDPNAVMAEGLVSQSSNSQVTVKDSIFLLTPQTIILDSKGSTATSGALSVNTNINVVGIKQQDALIAKQIQILPGQGTSTLPEVRGEATVAQSPTSTQTTSQATGTTASEAPDPNTASGLFIYETPPASAPR